MKKTICLPVMLILMSLVSYGQEKSNNLKINILSPIASTLNLQYEHVIKKDQSFQLGFFYTGYSNSGTKISGFGITPEYRFYLSDDAAPKGVYVAPFLRYQNYDLTDDLNDKGTLSTFGGGLILGRQWVFKDKISLDLFIGPQYNSGSVSASSGSSGNFSVGSVNGFGVRAGVCFGILF
jgi:hypothetical protein